jgi:TetR/AcrR family transcriptional repressor of nem operon
VGADRIFGEEANMRVSREQAAENREKIVDTAAKVFRENGYGGIGVADLMKAAGFTHGGFYRNFESKEALLAEACTRTFDELMDRWRTLVSVNPDAPFQAITAAYLSKEHRDHPRAGCAMASLGPELARLSDPSRSALTNGVRAQVDLLAGLLPDRPESDRRKAALVAYASMVGAMVLARAVNDDALSEELLEVVKDAIDPGHREPGK